MRAASGDNRLSASQCRSAVNDDTAVATWVRLAYSYHHIVRRLERALDEHALSLAQFEVLANLHYHSGIVQNDLARRLLVSKGNVCGLIDRLAAAGLVRRRVCPDDRRANRLFLTQRGSQVIGETMPVHLALIRSLMGRISTADLSRLGRLLDRLETAVADDDARPLESADADHGSPASNANS